MYTSFYKLKKEAFHITPDPEFLFLSPSHKEALGSVIYGVGQRKGFVLLTGEVGVGKTTIIRSYLEQADRRKLKIIYVFNSNVSFYGLLKTIFQELGLDASTDDIYQMVNRLHEVLIEEFRKGFNVVLIIDEAQNMPVETLENLRMLSNLETSTDKLIQIVFSGQPEFEHKLGMKELRQLRQRIAVKATIRPLTADESLAYIRHRLEKASAENMAIFADGALKKIVKTARGVPRIINILCENSLVTALGYRKKKVTAGIAREVIKDFKSGDRRSSAKKIFVPAVTAVIVFSLLALYVYRGNLAPDVRNREAARGTPEITVPMPEKTDAGTEVALSDNGDEKATINNKTKKGQSGEDSGGPVVKIVRRGDTLSRLVEEVYGTSSKSLISFVKKSNSSIDDVDLIDVGKKIIFPPKEKGTGKAHE